MRSVMAVGLLVAACGGGDDGGGGDGGGGNVQLICEDMQKAVTQRPGRCRLAIDPNDPLGCPQVLDAYCTGDCQAGRLASSQQRCERVSPQLVEFDFVQTLNGVDGLTVLLVDGGGSRSSVCEFRPCL